MQIIILKTGKYHLEMSSNITKFWLSYDMFKTIVHEKK